jgi:hypothetical protein
MGVILVISFVFYTLLSWVILFRDAWTLEVLATKFYPQWSSLIWVVRDFLAPLKLNTVPTILFAIFVLISFTAYFLAWKKTYSPKKIILLSVIFQIIVFFSYPILSTDVLNYILSDRVAVKYGQNVWTTPPKNFNFDPYYYLVYPVYPKGDWNNQTRIYGPVNQIIYSAVTFVSGDDFLVNLAAHKAVVLIFNLGTLVLVYKIFKRYFPEKLQFGLTLVFWNPLFILETVGSGHNDILMIFFILLSYLFYLRKQPVFTALMLALAINVKSTALLLAPLYFAVMPLTLYLPALIIFSGALFLTMGTNLPAFITRTFFSTNLYWQSLPQQVSKISPLLVKFLTPVFLLFYGWQSLRALFRRADPLVLYGQALLFYLLFSLGAHWNWYCLWVLTSFVFLGKGIWTKTAAAFTFTTALAYPLYWISLRFDFQHPVWPVIIYLLIAGGPVITYFYAKKNQKN